jgi:hypothetical protein
VYTGQIDAWFLFEKQYMYDSWQKQKKKSPPGKQMKNPDIIIYEHWIVTVYVM